MKRLCVFYDSPSGKTARNWLDKPIQWIVCKKCQKLLARGETIYSSLSKVFSNYAD
jgi:hypothetical protein